MAMGVNMFGLRLTIDAQALSKKGQPAQNTTGVASARPIQLTRPPWLVVSPAPAMSAIVTRNTGAPSSAPIQNRRVMSTNSGFGSSVSEMVRGSSAMPQMGQAPGAG